MARVSTFKALNLESDDESDVEVDNTKEIQIEEALKSYQTALKLHSSRDTLDQAGAAYDELFKSEIFKLPEAQSEYDRVVAWESQQDAVETYEIPLVAEDVAVQTVTENAPSSLPQVLHLSYKNRGEFYLDRLRARLQQPPEQDEDPRQKEEGVRDQIVEAVKDFAEALDKDEDDVDLWRRTAKAARILGSRRAERFCLETAVQEHEDSLEEVIPMPSFEARFDRNTLSKVHTQIQDDIAVAEDGPLQSIPPALRDQLEPYKALPEHVARHSFQREAQAERHVIHVPERSLDAIGACILEQLLAEQSGISARRPGAAIDLQIPEEEVQPDPPALAKSQDGRNALSTTESVASREQSAAIPNDTTVTTIPLRDSPHSSRRASTQSPSLARSELPGRKRSTDVAGMPETPDGERSRSKRIRTRKSTGGPGLGLDTSANNEPGQDAKNDVTLQADRWLFDLMRDVFRRMDVKMLCDANQLRRIVMTNSPPALGEGPIKLGRAMQDLYQAMISWSPKKTENFLQTKKSATSDLDTTNAGLLAFLDSSAGRNAQSTSPVTIWADVDAFTTWVNESWLTTEQVALGWVQTMLSPKPPFEHSPEEQQRQSLYMARAWSEELKTVVFEIISLVEAPLVKSFLSSRESDDLSYYKALFETAENAFEIHLDKYTSMTGPTAEVDEEAKLTQKGRLGRWYQIAWETQNWYTLRLQAADPDLNQSAILKQEPLLLRHVWASIFYMKALDEVSREYLLACIEDTKRQLGPKAKALSLPNNSTMTEISSAAADREISKLETMDFFMSVFGDEEQHPVAVVEKLEPILIPTLLSNGRSNRAKRRPENGNEDRSETTDSSSAFEGSRDGKHELLSEFVSKADPAFRLSLWYRLRDAYQTMQFHPKVLLINFKIISALVHEMQSASYADMSVEERERVLLNWLHEVHELLTKCYALITSGLTSLSELEFEQMRLSAASLIAVFTLLHTVALYDDYATALQKGPLLTNPFKAYPSESFHAAALRFHEMKLQTIIILYRAIEEAAEHYPDRPKEQKYVDQYEFLTYIHYELGVRRICKASDNMFLTFMRTELIKLQKSQPIYRDLAQVLYDLYDLNCFAAASEKEDHGCEPDYLDRETAFELVDFVLERAKATNMKDLPKVDLGKSVEKVQNALGPVKSTQTMSRNRKMVNAYLKTALSPFELFQCLKGVSALSTIPVAASEAPLASKGWYFLMAQINLAKHRRLKGTQPTGDEDLETAVSYLGYELEYDAEKWESWYRLGYANDCLIEEAVLWTTEKLNGPPTQLANMQRASIHAYAQAVATAQRNADATPENKLKLAELYSEFATRMFASTRPPFNAEAFELTEFPLRHFSGPAAGGGTYTQKPFKQLRVLQAYKISISLLKKAIFLRPAEWQYVLLLGKCYWRAHVYEKVNYRSTRQILCEQAFGCFERVLKTMPSRRESKGEPILEPVYKPIFAVLKTVKYGDTTVQQASAKIVSLLTLQKQFEAGDIEALPTEGVPSQAAWLEFLISVFKALRAADKAKWHHRLHFKMAQLIYEYNGGTAEAARAARDFMVEEKLYSVKTLALTVWKPENERPGRHWVYMTRYARFVAQILEQAADLEGMQQLARRVRKKTGEFFEHIVLWKDVLSAHLRLHRAHYKIQDCPDDSALRNLNHEDFRPRAEAIEKWSCDPATTHPLPEALREINEMKKLNAQLVDPGPIDDLLCDIYTIIYTTIGPTLPVPDKQAAAAPTPAGNTATGTPEPSSTATNAPSATATPERHGLLSVKDVVDDSTGARSRANSLQPSGAAAPSETAVHRPRPRTITRVNILKRAQEAAAPKVTTESAKRDKDAATAANGAEPGKKQEVKVMIRRRSRVDGAADADADADNADNDDGNEADASSELSEIDSEGLEGVDVEVDDEGDAGGDGAEDGDGEEGEGDEGAEEGEEAGGEDAGSIDEPDEPRPISPPLGEDVGMRDGDADGGSAAGEG